MSDPFENVYFPDELKRFVKAYGLVACKCDQTNYAYDKLMGMYKVLDSVELNRLIHEYITTNSATELPWHDYSFNIMSKHISTLAPYVEKMGAKEGVIVLKNGTFKTATMKLYEHSKKNLAISALPWEYDETATCPRFEQLLEEIGNGDEELRLTLEELCGAALTHCTAPQKLIEIEGDGQNSKSTFLEILRLLAGVAVTADLNLSDLTGDKAFDRYILLNASLGLIHELPAGLTLEKVMNDNVKKIVCSERLSCERKFKDKVIFTPQVILCCATNYPLIIDSPSYSLKRRLLILRFTRTFTEEEKDPFLLDKIKAEFSGVINVALRGYQRLKAQDYVYTYQKKSDAYYDRMLRESNPMYSFVSQYVVACPGKRLKNETLLDRYMYWAAMSNVKVTGNLQGVSAQLGNTIEKCGIHFVPRKSNGIRYRDGIALKKIKQ